MSRPRVIEMLRVSSAGQVRRDTPEIQRRGLDRLRATVPCEVVDRIDLGVDVSGALDPERRPDIIRLKALLATERVDEVRVHAVDRLGRPDDNRHLLYLLQLLAGARVVVRDTEGDTWDLRTPDGLDGIYAELRAAARERAKIARRTTGGKQSAAMAGRLAGGEVPYGYQWTGSAVVAHEEQASIVQRVFSLASTTSCSAIADVLNAEGAVAPRGGRWDRRTITRLVRQPAYLGSRTQKVAGETYTQSLPPLVDETTFERAQRAFDSRRRHDGRPAKDGTSLCQGFLICGECGQTMVRHANDKRYLCRSRHEQRRYGPPCANVRHPTDQIDAKVWAEIVRIASDPDSFAVATSETAPATSSWADQLAGAEKRLAELRKTQGEWLTLSRRGLLDAQTLESNLRGIKRDVETCLRSAAVAKEAIASEAAIREAESTARDALAAFAHQVEHAEGEARRVPLGMLIPKHLEGYGIHVARDGSIELVLAIPRPPKHGIVGGNAPTKVGSDLGGGPHCGFATMGGGA